ncbi:PREDICTED: centromere protein S [Nanorana parkeri]|uniref:centromere protein S n=1 Tax=Nanorana parkeri TaxID=125878 RepID=UPI0008546255|nr:PREDICTED: centromere protein S [Nanorana parkeri]
MAEDAELRLQRIQRLKAAVHYTVGCLCQEVAEDKEIQFSKQAIAAISETTFRQCETFAKDLEMFARHGKRSTINVDDVKLLSRRSRSLHAHISSYSEEVASNNQEQKEKKRKKKSVVAGKGKRQSDGDSAMPDTEEPAME